jgi:hypothetical protein
MLGYMACAVSIDEPDIDSIHAITYEAAKAELPSRDYHQLIDPANPYREKNLTDADYFNQQLPLYRIKPLYIFIIYLFYKMGISLTTATLLPSLLGFIGIGLILFFWMSGFMKGGWAFNFSTLMMLSPPLWTGVLSATPDILCGCFTLLAFYFIIEKKNMLTGFIFLIAGLLMRIDLVLLSVMTALLLYFSAAGGKRIRLGLFIAWLSVSIVIFSLIAFLPGRFNEGTIKYFMVIPSDFAEEHSRDSLSQYFILLVKGLFDTRYSMISFILLLATVTGIIRLRLTSIQRDFDLQVILLLVANIFLRYLLHPVIDDRFLIAHYLIITLIFLKTIFEKKSGVPVNSNVQS